jgi:hypothetical protein
VETGCRGGQSSPRAVASSGNGRKEGRKTSLELAHFPVNLVSQFISRAELGYLNDHKYLLRYSVP